MIMITDVINAAKDKLSTDIDGLVLPNWTRPIKRRGDNKSKQDIEDMFGAVSFVDECSALPRYVTDNLDDIPIMRMDRGENGDFDIKAG
jgi:hypothetical protein